MAAGCLFGTTGLAVSLAPDDAGATSVGFGRVVLAGACLGLLAWWSSRRGGQRAVRGARSAPPRTWVMAFGALGVLGYQPFFFAGVERNGAAVGALVALGTAPAVTGLLEVLLGRHRPGLRWAWTTALAVLGVALVAGLADGAQSTVGRVDPWGVLASAAAGTCYAVYALAAARLIADGAGVTTTMGWLFGLAGVVALPWWWAGDRDWLGETSGVLAWLWLGLGATVCAYLLLGVGLARLRTSTVATLTLAEPVTATVLGVLVLSERLSPAAMVGVVLLGVALAALARGEMRNA